jgi:hypothetical protein
VAPGAIKYWPEVDGEDDPINEDPKIAAPKQPKQAVPDEERSKRLRERVQSVFSQQLGPVLNGHRPVRATVHVTHFEIIPKNRRAASGGAHVIAADVILVDAQSGQQLSVFRDQRAVLSAGSGAAGAVGAAIGGGLVGLATIAAMNAQAEARGISAEILIGEYVKTYSKWLNVPVS